MKRVTALFLILIALLGFGAALKAAELLPIAVTFIGRWNPTEDPVLLEDGGLQDIQNMRRAGKHFKGIAGHTIINTTSISAAPHLINGFHFRKDQPQESHVIVLAANSTTPTASYLYRNTTAVPTAGNFSGTILHTDSTVGVGGGRFAMAPAGNMVYSNGEETLIWGGNESLPTMFVTSTDSLTGTASVLTKPNDFTDQVRNTQRTSGQVAFIGGGIDAYTVLLLHASGVDGSTTITASETTAHTVTAAGNAQVDTAQYKFATGSFLFDGTGDYLTTADSADWNMADGNFTVDLWIRFAALPATLEEMVIFSQRADASNSAVFTLGNTAGVYSFTLKLRTAGAEAIPVNAVTWTAPAINTWYHIALVRGWGGAANSWAVAVNGTSLGAATLATTYPDVTAALQIGQGTTESGSIYPPAHNDTYVKATSKYGTDYWPYYTTDPAKSLTGGFLGNQWLAGAATITLQRFHIDLGASTTINKIYYENGHTSGTETTQGVQNFTFWGSDSSTAFAELTYGTDTGWTQLTTSASTMEQHAAADTADPKYLTVSNTTAYQYYAFKFPDTYGNVSYMGVRRIELQYVGVTRVAFNGWMDEIRISKGVARFTSNFTVPVSAYRVTAPYWVVGFTRPLQGVKFYVSGANIDTSTITVSEWNGVSWTALTATDNTAAGGVSLAQTGTVTWASTVNTSKPKYISGLSLYYYQFALSSGAATIYHATVDAPIQPIRNIWNGSEGFVGKLLKYDGTTYKDYTDEVSDEDAINSYADVSSLTNSQYLLIGFAEPQQALNFTFIAGSENSTATTAMTAKYWDGQEWTAVAALFDGTATSTTSFSKGGTVSFQSPGRGVEFSTAISDEVPLFYYQISFANTIDSTVKIGEIRGVMAPPPMPIYKFAESFRNRLFLFNDANGDRNKAQYSVENSPDIFNGADSGYLYFGDNTELTAAGQLYNVYRTGTADQLIVTKKNETYRLSGDDPTTWVVQRLSGNIGCIAPLSLAVCDAAEGAEEGAKRQVAIWQSDKGFMMTDGAAIVNISQDIECYFNPLDARYIPTARQSKTVAWYDTFLKSYKALISSGSGATQHNLELEYSIVAKQWTKIVRRNATTTDPLQSGFPVFDPDGIGYTYGGNATGFMYRLENGSTFNGTAIEQFLHTKDMILDPQVPLFRKSTVKYMRTAHKKKTAGGNISIAHYGDQVLTVSGSSNQSVPSAINMATAPYNTQSCALGPFLYHSLKFTLSGSTISDGMELIGIGLWVEPQTIIR